MEGCCLRRACVFLLLVAVFTSIAPAARLVCGVCTGMSSCCLAPATHPSTETWKPPSPSPGLGPLLCCSPSMDTMHSMMYACSNAPIPSARLLASDLVGCSCLLNHGGQALAWANQPTSHLLAVCDSCNYSFSVVEPQPW